MLGIMKSTFFLYKLYVVSSPMGFFHYFMINDSVWSLDGSFIHKYVYICKRFYAYLLTLPT